MKNDFHQISEFLRAAVVRATAINCRLAENKSQIESNTDLLNDPFWTSQSTFLSLLTDVRERLKHLRTTMRTNMQTSGYFCAKSGSSQSEKLRHEIKKKLCEKHEASSVTCDNEFRYLIYSMISAGFMVEIYFERLKLHLLKFKQIDSLHSSFVVDLQKSALFFAMAMELLSTVGPIITQIIKVSNCGDGDTLISKANLKFFAPYFKQLLIYCKEVSTLCDICQNILVDLQKAVLSFNTVSKEVNIVRAVIKSDISSCVCKQTKCFNRVNTVLCHMIGYCHWSLLFFNMFIVAERASDEHIFAFTSNEKTPEALTLWTLACWRKHACFSIKMKHNTRFSTFGKTVISEVFPSIHPFLNDGLSDDLSTKTFSQLLTNSAIAAKSIALLCKEMLEVKDFFLPEVYFYRPEGCGSTDSFSTLRLWESIFSTRIFDKECPVRPLSCDPADQKLKEKKVDFIISIISDVVSTSVKLCLNVLLVDMISDTLVLLLEEGNFPKTHAERIKQLYGDVHKELQLKRTGLSSCVEDITYSLATLYFVPCCTDLLLRTESVGSIFCLVIAPIASDHGTDFYLWAAAVTHVALDDTIMDNKSILSRAVKLRESKNYSLDDVAHFSKIMLNEMKIEERIVHASLENKQKVLDVIPPILIKKEQDETKIDVSPAQLKSVEIVAELASKCLIDEKRKHETDCENFSCILSLLTVVVDSLIVSNPSCNTGDQKTSSRLSQFLSNNSFLFFPLNKKQILLSPHILYTLAKVAFSLAAALFLVRDGLAQFPLSYSYARAASLLLFPKGDNDLLIQKLRGKSHTLMSLLPPSGFLFHSYVEPFCALCNMMISSTPYSSSISEITPPSEEDSRTSAPTEVNAVLNVANVSLTSSSWWCFELSNEYTYQTFPVAAYKIASGGVHSGWFSRATWTRQQYLSAGLLGITPVSHSFRVPEGAIGIELDTVNDASIRICRSQCMICPFEIPGEAGDKFLGKPVNVKISTIVPLVLDISDIDEVTLQPPRKRLRHDHIYSSEPPVKRLLQHISSLQKLHATKSARVVDMIELLINLKEESASCIKSENSGVPPFEAVTSTVCSPERSNSVGEGLGMRALDVEDSQSQISCSQESIPKFTDSSKQVRHSCLELARHIYTASEEAWNSYDTRIYEIVTNVVKNFKTPADADLEIFVGEACHFREKVVLGSVEALLVPSLSTIPFFWAEAQRLCQTCFSLPHRKSLNLVFSIWLMLQGLPLFPPSLKICKEEGSEGKNSRMEALINYNRLFHIDKLTNEEDLFKTIENKLCSLIKNIALRLNLNINSMVLKTACSTAITSIINGSVPCSRLRTYLTLQDPSLEAFPWEVCDAFLGFDVIRSTRSGYLLNSRQGKAGNKGKTVLILDRSCEELKGIADIAEKNSWEVVTSDSQYEEFTEKNSSSANKRLGQKFFNENAEKIVFEILPDLGFIDPINGQHNNSLIAYCGHGKGGRALPLSVLQSIIGSVLPTKNDNVLGSGCFKRVIPVQGPSYFVLMGCSAGSILMTRKRAKDSTNTERSPYTPVSVPVILSSIFGNFPTTMVACMWQLTAKQADKFTIDLLLDFNKNNNKADISELVAKFRLCTKHRFAVGGAIVVYSNC